METVSPALAGAFTLPRQDIHGYLAGAERLADRLGESAPAPVAALCELVSDLTAIVRGVLLNHPSNAAGSCPACATEWPCRAVRSINRLVRDPGTELVRLARSRPARR